MSATQGRTETPRRHNLVHTNLYIRHGGPKHGFHQHPQRRHRHHQGRPAVDRQAQPQLIRLDHTPARA
ncbi:hypothetical protein ABM90_13625 [Rhodococcus erythropolis]|nr:hypothetical protein ABM90_13625 [Rhodococcus erythropolis]